MRGLRRSKRYDVRQLGCASPAWRFVEWSRLCWLPQESHERSMSALELLAEVGGAAMPIAMRGCCAVVVVGTTLRHRQLSVV